MNFHMTAMANGHDFKRFRVVGMMPLKILSRSADLTFGTKDSVTVTQMSGLRLFRVSFSVLLSFFQFLFTVFTVTKSTLFQNFFTMFMIIIRMIFSLVNSHLFAIFSTPIRLTGSYLFSILQSVFSVFSQTFLSILATISSHVFPCISLSVFRVLKRSHGQKTVRPLFPNKVFGGVLKCPSF